MPTLLPVRVRLFCLAALVAPAALAQPATTPDTPAVAAEVPPPRRLVSLYADLRAAQVGDLVTVLLVERAAARRATASQDAMRSGVSAAGNGPAGLGGFFGLDAEVSADRASDSRTVQSDLLTGTIAARVVAVDAAGNLTLAGERRLDVDGQVHLMRVSGLVRPADVTTANTVLSHQIAGADVVYRREGGGPSFLRGRKLAFIATAAVLIGAIVLGSSVSSAVTPAP